MIIGTVSGCLTNGLVSALACSLSIAFPTATTLKCDVGSSQPAYSLWKYLIAARYPFTVWLWFLYAKHLDAMNTVSSLTALSTPSSSYNHGLRFA
ncbi:unnamed protein product [Ectocarpus sp. CCAP 1310/34]|nr:unnamed protein product [Ectocarpus sp. CCAP 1310/34]